MYRLRVSLFANDKIRGYYERKNLISTEYRIECQYVTIDFRDINELNSVEESKEVEGGPVIKNYSNC